MEIKTNEGEVLYLGEFDRLIEGRLKTFLTLSTETPQGTAHLTFDHYRDVDRGALQELADALYHYLDYGKLKDTE